MAIIIVVLILLCAALLGFILGCIAGPTVPQWLDFLASKLGGRPARNGPQDRKPGTQLVVNTGSHGAAVSQHTDRGSQSPHSSERAQPMTAEQGDGKADTQGDKAQEIERLKLDLKQANAKIEEAQREIQKKTQKCEQHEEAHLKAQAELEKQERQLNQSSHNLTETTTKLRAKERECQQLNAAVSTAQDELEAKGNELNAIKEERDNVAATLANTEQQLAEKRHECNQLGEKCRGVEAERDAKIAELDFNLKAQVPHFCLNGPMRHRLDDLRSQAATGNGNARAALAFLHAAHVMMQSGLEATTTLFDTLAELGRSLVLFYAAGQTSKQVADVLSQWATGFNGEADDYFELRVPGVATPVASNWMTFPPGARTIGVIETWAVFDGQGIVAKKAIVT
jgi:hypothetical protein